MIIQRISPNSAANHLYIFNSYNYKNIKNIPVTPIKPVKKLSAFEEDRYRYSALYQEETQNGKAVKAIETKQVNSIREEYASTENVSYNTESMYEREKMSAEASILLGMNIDLFA